MKYMPWTRRGLFLAAAGAVALFSGLSERAMAQTPPGVLIVGQVAEPKSRDPAAVTAVNDFRSLVNVYEGLPRSESGTREV
ncbi:MAG: ABC transporter substrate-binding protein, partial [Boseongicola sp. SB0676_bin_33]|nr:ABC transporter substrate-binding protein [Boseongicola sp. SB0676_bin_33]